jgi:hypothetical protein
MGVLRSRGLSRTHFIERGQSILIDSELVDPDSISLLEAIQSGDYIEWILDRVNDENDGILDWRKYREDNLLAQAYHLEPLRFEISRREIRRVEDE